ncbi:RNA-binding protein [Bradyrhizobium sp. F1.13.3]|uniref:RNA-binding protein n=1 Tax=Bradyrhizobium sp. F1.13.3 TaxID=3156351 RepID=UPI00339B3575
MTVSDRAETDEQTSRGHAVAQINQLKNEHGTTELSLALLFGLPVTVAMLGWLAFLGWVVFRTAQWALF